MDRIIVSELSIFSDVWKGKRSFSETFWVWYVLIGWVGLSYFGSKIVIATFIKSENLAPIFGLYLVIIILYEFWIVVGLWRSASKSESIWGGIVNLLILIEIAMSLMKVITFFKDLLATAP